MQTSAERFQQCYNAQTLVDEAHQIIVATDVEALASDQSQMLLLLDEVSESFAVEPDLVFADAGYCNNADLVALGREGKAQAAANAQTRPATHRMGEKLASDEGRAQYVKRKWISEAPNGWIKVVLGYRRQVFAGSRRCEASGISCAWR